jgi:hypothetical protein
MDTIFTESRISRLPWLSFPSIRSKILETAKKIAASQQKAASLQSTINNLNAEPPILKPVLLKRRAALLKSLNLSDAGLITAQVKVLIDLEKAALETQKTAAEDKITAAWDNLRTFLKAVLSALNISTDTETRLRRLR